MNTSSWPTCNPSRADVLFFLNLRVIWLLYHSSPFVKDFQPNLGFQKPLSRHLRTAIALGMLLLGCSTLHSQTPAAAAAKPASKIATIKSFRVVQEKDGPAVEILSTKPLVPSIQAVVNPDRLVIDLPNARLDTQQKRISVQADQISTIRADQFQQNPPIARVVVDLMSPRAYTWDAAGNRLVVHLGKNPNQASSSPFQQPTVTTLTPEPQPVVASIRAAGPLALAENTGSAGSTITTGADTAILNLSSGGEVHVCPGTTVSVTPSQNRHNLMIGMNTGAMEAHFGLDASSDSIMTPDFRILLVGPGQFHYAISADNQGNTCVRALPGNTASAIVTELLGDRTYQVKTTDQLVFRSGHLDRVDMAVPPECGCPPPRDPPLRATSNLPAENRRPDDALPPMNPNPAAAVEAHHATNMPATGLPATATTRTIPSAPLDASIAPNELHVQIEAPLVFHATGPPPAPTEDVRDLPLDSRSHPAPALAAPLPPSANENPQPATATASANPPPSRGFFKKLGGFFAALFR
jgi:hypothetical protein